LERRRLERDLHDGAQQRLVSIGFALRHAQHQLGASTVEQASRTLDEAIVEVKMAIDELRELARGLSPAQLDAGLAPAFQHLARRVSVPVEVTAPRERYASNPIEAESQSAEATAATDARLRTDKTAQIIIAGHAFLQNLRRGHYELGFDASSATRVAVAFTELARTI
jgi:signal transduction histidine kinase